MWALIFLNGYLVFNTFFLKNFESSIKFIKNLIKTVAYIQALNLLKILHNLRGSRKEIKCFGRHMTKNFFKKVFGDSLQVISFIV